MRRSPTPRLPSLPRSWVLAALVMLAALVVGCAASAPAVPTPTIVASPTAPPPPTVAATPTTAGTPTPSPAPTAAPSGSPTAATVQVPCRDWRAWHDSMPGGTPTLHVVGTCDLPTPGHQVTLQRKAPQGINPRDLLLEKIVRPPSGAVTQVITPVEVRYEEKTDLRHDTVTILTDGVTIRVDVTS